MTKAAEEAGYHREQEQVERSTARVMGGRDMTDQEARDIAHSALNRIDIHEILCTERWNQQRTGMAIMQKSLDHMSRNTLGRIPAGIIAVLTGLVGWLAARAFPVIH